MAIQAAATLFASGMLLVGVVVAVRSLIGPGDAHPGGWPAAAAAAVFGLVFAGPLAWVGARALLDLLGTELILEGPVRVSRRGGRHGLAYALVVEGVTVTAPAEVASTLHDEDVVRVRCGRHHHELKVVLRRARLSDSSG